MLGKLLKQEFRATGRIILPVLGALIVLAFLASLSGSGLINGVTDVPVLRFLMGMIEFLFGIGVVAAGVVTVVIMISRFYRNLLQDEGYLMFTLPVSVHELVWSKLIVALVWFLVTGIVIFLVMGLLGLVLSRTNLVDLMAEFSSDWEEIWSQIVSEGLLASFRRFFLAGAVCTLLGTVCTCLHFYAAMAMGHMFNKHKILLSIVFFVLISIAFSLMTTSLNMAGFSQISENEFLYAESMALLFNTLSRMLWWLTLSELVQAAVLYLATVLCLKRGLNLA